MADCTCCGDALAPRTQAADRHNAHEGRGLCAPCYGRERHSGNLDQYPRRTWSRDELLDEWDVLRSQGHTRVQAAERLGVKPGAFERALQRARAAGDPRAALGVPGGMTGAIAAAERASAAAREQTPVWVPAHERGDTHALAR